MDNCLNKNWRGLCRILKSPPKPTMVSGPVADLLAPKSQDSYIEYKNAAGDSLRFQIFTKNNVKMISLNGIDLPLDELFNIIDEVEADSEINDKDNDILLRYALITAITFVIIMLYMKYVFTIAFG